MNYFGSGLKVKVDTYNKGWVSPRARVKARMKAYIDRKRGEEVITHQVVLDAREPGGAEPVPTTLLVKYDVTETVTGYIRTVNIKGQRGSLENHFGGSLNEVEV